MEKGILEFKKSREEFEKIFKTIPKEALAFLAKGDDYTLGGLLVHVVDVLKYYGNVLEKVLKNPKDIIRVKHETLESDNKLIHQGITEEDKRRFLEACRELHDRVATRLEKLSDDAFGAKVKVVYENSEEPYETSPSDLLTWLNDHYQEHIRQIPKILEKWKDKKKVNDEKLSQKDKV